MITIFYSFFYFMIFIIVRGRHIQIRDDILLFLLMYLQLTEGDTHIDLPSKQKKTRPTMKAHAPKWSSHRALTEP